MVLRMEVKSSEKSEAVLRREKIKKSEILKELNKIKLKLQAADREKVAHVYNRRGEFYPELRALQESEQDLTSQRKTDRIKLQQQLCRIKGMVKKFQRQLHDGKPSPELVEQLKVMMEEIETNITDFKDKQREHYEEIMKQERILGLEVVAMDKRFDSWTQFGSAQDVHNDPRPLPAPMSHRDTERDLPPEVKAFERFVADSGGLRAGWDEYDHGTFLRFRNQHKARPGFIQELVSSLPTKSHEDIVDHERWYQTYLQLNDDKKNAIKKWKERKEIEKEEILAKAERDEKEAEKKRLHEEKLQQEREDERQQNKLYLNKWKIEKEIERAEQEERILREKLEKAEKEKVQQQRKQALHEQVEEYRRLRLEQEESTRLEKLQREQLEQQLKQQQAASQIPKYRERDLVTVKQRRAEQEAKKKADEERQKRIQEKLRNQVERRVARDPSRLLQPTAGWIERQKDTAPPSGQLLHMPHKAVPGWRQGLQ